MLAIVIAILFAVKSAGWPFGGLNNLKLPADERSIVTEAIETAERARKELSENPATLFAPNEFWEVVRKQLLDAPRTVYTVKEMKVPPPMVAWLVISNLSGDLVATGRYHVYRGILATQGEALQAIFLRAVQELEAGGYHDRNAAEEDRKWLAQRIRMAG